MKYEMYKCDLCGKVTHPDNIFKIKVRSSSFINYCNFDSFGADKKIVDICASCITDIKEYIKNKHEKV